MDVEHIGLETARYLAFCSSRGGGNPAAVVQGAEALSDAQLQEVAATIGVPATAFVLSSQSAALRLRFFTPFIEEAICGHGTVAALVHLASCGTLPSGRFELETQAGLLGAWVSGIAWLEYGVGYVWDPQVSRADVARALGLGLEDLHEDLPVLAASVGRAKLIVALPSVLHLDAIEPDREAICLLNKSTQTTGLVAFTFPGRMGAFADVRHFAPLAGIDEDIATGNAHAALAAYLAHVQFLEDGVQSFVGTQGHRLGQPSRLETRVRVQAGAASEIAVGGGALRVSDD